MFRFILIYFKLAFQTIIVYNLINIISTCCACQSNTDCQDFPNGAIFCDLKLQQCVCGPGTRLFRGYCIKLVKLGDLCEKNEQCNLTEPNALCNFNEASLHLMICQCKNGFDSKDSKCFPVMRRNSFLGGTPHFDNGDLVPIFLGFLAAGLALMACCAGLIQLMRKKQTHRWDEPSPHIISLEGLVSIQAGNLLRPPRPSTDLSCGEQFQDLPPSYEEAIKQSLPVTLLPVPSLRPTLGDKEET